MTGTAAHSPSQQRVLVATDRSETADKAVRWAASMAEPVQAELLLQVPVPEAGDGAAGAVPEATVVQLGRRVSLGLGACVALIGTAMLANAQRVPRWASSLMSGLSSVLIAGLLGDLGSRPSQAAERSRSPGPDLRSVSCGVIAATRNAVRPDHLRWRMHKIIEARWCGEIAGVADGQRVTRVYWPQGLRRP